MPYNIGIVHCGAMPPGRQLALIPAGYGTFTNLHQFRAMWSDGSDAGIVFAAMTNLATPRASNTPNGERCDREALFLERLQTFARARGLDLPVIEPTVSLPPWAQHDA